jgi:hypothetical protein
MQPQPTPDQVPPYVALCFEHEPGAADGHSHVSAVRTQDPDGGETRWTAVEFVSAVRSGEQFVLIGADGQRATLEPAVCPRCPSMTITVEGDASVAACSEQS